MNLVTHRQKLIKLADRSEHGWRVVKEYESDSLAENEDDEKRIVKAEKAAASAAAAKKKKVAVRPAVPNPGRMLAPQQQFKTNWPTRARSFSYQPAGPSSSRPFTSSRPIGPCFRCSEMGHLQSSCPKLAAPQYPQFSCTEVDGWGEHPSESNDTFVDMSARYCEASEHGVETVRVKGRLKQHLPYWRDVLNPSTYILDIIENGYRLPFVSMPPTYSASNHSSTRNNVEFVTESVSELVKNGCARLVAQNQLFCKFKYEDFRTALDYFEEDAYLFTFDLKSGYHHIDIHVEHQSYLGFQWKDQFYVFTVLPFGLSTACYIFTKVLRPVVKHIRALGIRLVLYLDDGLVSVKASETHSISVSRLVEEIITKAGLVINREKSKFTPSKQAAWLGFDIDLALGEIRVSRDKLHTLKILLHSINEETLIPVRVIASIVGKIISMSLVLGDIARLRTRCLYSVILSRSSWSDHVMIMPEARDELSFRVNNIDSFNGRKVWRAPAAVPVVYSDASDTGFGSYTVAHGDDIAHGQWTPLESHKSSTWRELRAVTLTLGAFAPRLSDHRVGSGKEELQAEAIAIFKLAAHYNILIEPEWLPREQNEVADYLSRIVDYDDWGLSIAAF
ncbi:PREDICTED: uncharacterized protein LOC100639089 [Amphimedon queenslandica]|uniref:CCHC-type domain-containing protein n=1 Tax=Amphimedon queenslandica TaxID=400682 RepID=A0AAN0IPP6_AMPQE|nr:PREDICTED: uncharacterized protein LOC100639089 [Amphimedon queenslandica]|eukprot:XP_011405606.1 PREDICTED: uncharacterized protein LOC100639089 [Amphimedon queenslandica]